VSKWAKKVLPPTDPIPATMWAYEQWAEGWRRACLTWDHYISV